MRQRPKKLTDPIAMSRLAPEPGGPVGYGFAERLARMLKFCELGVLSEACQYAHPCVGNDKLKRVATYSVRDKTGVDPAAVVIDIVLQFSQCPKKSFDKSSRHIVRRCVLRVFGPLIPERLIAGLRIVAEQWENPRDFVDTAAGNGTLIERLIHHAYETRFERYGAISVWQEASGHGQFNQRTNSSRFSNADTPCLGKPARDSLPKQIISIFKTALNIACPLHAVLGNPPMLYSAIQHYPDILITTGDTESALAWQADRMNQFKLMQYWRENSTRATGKDRNSRFYRKRFRESGACNFG
ncbi:hypothetical protein [Ensifer sp. BR816]|uniref:hypothetical protein n=1 Tax=Rhizobium sp. (strain BR816) TaxID=1057002 RepID=UPI000361B16E|nr:hypothetical protein [Ensifer sp. BR816]